MINLEKYCAYGILEAYVLGSLTNQNKKEVEQMAASHTEVSEKLDEIESLLEEYAHAQAVTPHPTIKPMLLASIDYTERINNGEQPTFPPLLTETSQLSDYKEWIEREDMKLPAGFTDLFAKIIGYSAEVVTAIVWIKDSAEPEIHHHQFEKFLIAEGTCDIYIEDEVYHFEAGDFFSVPLYKYHSVKVTSAVACKVILQRIAA